MSATQLIISSDVSGLRPQNMPELFKLAEMISGSAMAPKDYRGKPNDTSIAMMMGLEVGLNPMQAIQNIAVINGRPSIWGDAMLALVQNHPSFQSIEESIDESTMTAVCVVCRKGGKPHTETFSKHDAELAGLWSDKPMVYSHKYKKEVANTSPWFKYPKRMLAMRARGFALRNQFADALLGLISREEARDTPEEIEINPVNTETKETTGNSITIEKQENTLPEYTQEQFDQKKEGWILAISKGKKASGIVSMIKTKFTLTPDQEAMILNLKAEAV